MKRALVCGVALAAILLACGADSAGKSSTRPVKGRITGDWQILVHSDDRQMPSVLSLTADKEDRLTGKWISLWGTSELSALKYEADELTFKRVRRVRDSETTLTFTGAVKRGKLSGKLSSDRGESKVEGKRIKTVPRIAGSWDLKLKEGEQDSAATLMDAGELGTTSPARE